MTKTRPKIKRSAIINKSEIARIIGVSSQYIGQLMNGRKHNERRLQQISRIIQKELGHISRSKAA